ncbi:MAG: ketopantoate reductase family protein [Mangrovibacterium sp.]
MEAGKINSVYIVGLGAIGGMYASRLQEVQSLTVKVIADRERIERYQNETVTVNGKPYSFNYVTPGDENPPADLILIAVKSTTLGQAIHDINGFVGKETVVMSLLNGISSEELIGRQIGMEHLLYAFGLGMDAMREGTAISYTNMGRIVFGEKENQKLSERVLAVKDLFDQAQIPYRIPENMLHAMWFKFMLNVGVNQASAILRAPYGVFQKNQQARELMVTAAREVLLLSQKCGIHLLEDQITEFLSIMDGLDPNGKTSMLQDVEAGRKTEVDIFAGTVIELGRKYEIETPLNDAFFRIIRAMEEMQQ